MSSEKQRLITLIEAYDQELKDFKITSLRQRVELQKRKRELEEKLNEMLPVVEELENRKKKLHEEITRIRQQLQNAKEKRGSVLKENEELLRKLNQLRPQVQELRERVAVLEHQVQELENRKSKLENRVEYLTNEIQRRKEIKSRLKGVNKRLDHLKAEKKRFEEQLREKESVLELLNKLHELQESVKVFVKSLDWLAYTLNQVSLDEVVAPLDMESRKRIVKALHHWEDALGAYKGRQYAVLFKSLVDCMHEILDLYLESMELTEKVKNPTDLKEKFFILTNYAVPITSRHVDTVTSILERMDRGIEVLPKMSTVVEIMQVFEKNLLVLCSLPKELRFSE